MIAQGRKEANVSHEATDHVEETVQRLAELDEAHDRAATRMQRFVIWLTAVLGTPASVAIILSLMVLWMLGNYVAHALGISALEEFPFAGLHILATIAALIVALLILSTQRHEEALAEKRARLTLQIATLSEKKTTKLSSMLEEQRRDNPMLASRVDSEAKEMERSSDPLDSSKRIDEARPKN